jgi:hypothetical protein
MCVPPSTYRRPLPRPPTWTAACDGSEGPGRRPGSLRNPKHPQLRTTPPPAASPRPPAVLSRQSPPALALLASASSPLPGGATRCGQSPRLGPVVTPRRGPAGFRIVAASRRRHALRPVASSWPCRALPSVTPRCGPEGFRVVASSWWCHALRLCPGAAGFPYRRLAPCGAMPPHQSRSPGLATVGGRCGRVTTLVINIRSSDRSTFLGALFPVGNRL